MTQDARTPFVVVGLNYGRWIIESLLNSDEAGRYFRLDAVCDLDPLRASVEAKKTNSRILTFEEILGSSDLPAVGLFTGPSHRSDLIRRLIRAGKHVMTTKPFELDAHNAVRVLEEARSRGCVVHLNSPGPTVPSDIAQIECWRDQYQLGKPVACRAETYASYHEQSDGKWYDSPATCPLAPIFRIGIYLINDLVHLFGRAESVQSFESRIRTGRPTPDNAQLAIQFDNGALANIFASFCIDDGQ